jgi:transposase
VATPKPSSPSLTAILVIVYHLLRDDQPYVDLGCAYFDNRDHELATRRLTHRLERLGYRVTPQPFGSAA